MRFSKEHDDKLPYFAKGIVIPCTSTVFREVVSLTTFAMNKPRIAYFYLTLL